MNKINIIKFKMLEIIDFTFSIIVYILLVFFSDVCIELIMNAIAVPFCSANTLMETFLMPAGAKKKRLALDLLSVANSQ